MCVCVCVLGWVGGCTSAGRCLYAFRLTYSLHHAQAPYCLRPPWMHHIFFPRYLINDTIFGKRSRNVKYVFWFSLLRLLEIFLVLRRNRGDNVKNAETSSCTALVIFVGFLMKLEFSRQIFEKVSNTTFHQNPSSGSRVVPCGRTDMKLTVAFYNFVNASKNITTLVSLLHCTLFFLMTTWSADDVNSLSNCLL
jgi:hypothetical protein